MSKVDLNKLKDGDVVVLRDGQRKEVRSIYFKNKWVFPCVIRYVSGKYDAYKENGSWRSVGEDESDIVEVIPAKPVYTVPLPEGGTLTIEKEGEMREGPAPCSSHTFQVTRAPEEPFRQSEFWRLRYADGSMRDVSSWTEVLEEGTEIGLLSITRMVREVTTREATAKEVKECGE